VVRVSRPGLRLTERIAGPILLTSWALSTPGSGEGRPDAEYRALFEAFPSAELLLDEGLKILVANEAALRMFGASGADLRGRPFDALFATASRPPLLALFVGLRSGPSPHDRLATEGLGAGGVPFPAEVVIVRLPSNLRVPFAAVVRSLAEPAPSRAPASKPGARPYSLPELLMANRLKEMV
jgi:PAS domain S-box-containing protein